MGITIDNFLPDAEQNALDSYSNVMEATNADALKERYNKALSICDELNEGL
ncbi:hypothetical protein [Butyrivibrio sp. M55]|uniref:hypothetical protein n=1 Tax=Butyrivibrio sp. M55 TaxID=1855323 RepID=UPI00158724B1|nr:hypothetical protein [Butyrivibrio sp. M55]